MPLFSFNKKMVFKFEFASLHIYKKKKYGTKDAVK